MFKLFFIFINKILVNGKYIVSENLLKYFIKYLLKSNFKFNYKFIQLLISYLSFIFRCNLILENKRLNCKFIIFTNNKILLGIKFLFKYITFNSKIDLLQNITYLLLRKKTITSEILKYKKLFLFYRW